MFAAIEGDPTLPREGLQFPVKKIAEANAGDVSLPLPADPLPMHPIIARIKELMTASPRPNIGADHCHRPENDTFAHPHVCPLRFAAGCFRIRRHLQWSRCSHRHFLQTPQRRYSPARRGNAAGTHFVAHLGLRFAKSRPWPRTYGFQSLGLLGRRRRGFLPIRRDLRVQNRYRLRSSRLLRNRSLLARPCRLGSEYPAGGAGIRATRSTQFRCSVRYRSPESILSQRVGFHRGGSLGSDRNVSCRRICLVLKSIGRPGRRGDRCSCPPFAPRKAWRSLPAAERGGGRFAF